jgi:hypothetical protein
VPEQAADGNAGRARQQGANADRAARAGGHPTRANPGGFAEHEHQRLGASRAGGAQPLELRPLIATHPVGGENDEHRQRRQGGGAHQQHSFRSRIGLGSCRVERGERCAQGELACALNQRRLRSLQASLDAQQIPAVQP